MTGGERRDPVEPFRLPLSPPEFRRAVHSGLGRAVLHVREHGVGGEHRGILVDACVHARGYDPQCEWDRAAWLAGIIDASGDAGALRDEVVSACGGSAEDWDRKQQFELLALMAERGHAGAREAVRRLFEMWAGEHDLLGTRELVRLEGVSGLVRVAQVIGSRLGTDAGRWWDEYLPEVFAEPIPQSTADAAIADAAGHDADIARYWAAVKTGRETVAARVRAAEEASRRVVEPPRFEDAVVRAEFYGAVRAWARSADEAEISRALRWLETATDARRVRVVLTALGRRRSSAYLPELVRLLDHPERDVAFAAAQAFRHAKHDELRRWAWDAIEAGRLDPSPVALLIANYREGDAAALERLLVRDHERDVLHSLLFDTLHVCEAHADDALSVLLLLVYERTPCEPCRGHAAEQMTARGSIPAWVEDEMRWDSGAPARHA